MSITHSSSTARFNESHNDSYFFANFYVSRILIVVCISFILILSFVYRRMLKTIVLHFLNKFEPEPINQIVRSEIVNLFPGQIYKFMNALGLSLYKARVDKMHIVKYNYNTYLTLFKINPIKDIQHKLKTIQFYDGIKSFKKKRVETYTNGKFRFISKQILINNYLADMYFYEDQLVTVVILDFIQRDTFVTLSTMVFYKKRLLYYTRHDDAYDSAYAYSYTFKFKNPHVASSQYKFLANEFKALPLRSNEPRPIGLVINLTINDKQIRFYNEDCNMSNDSNKQEMCPICYEETALRTIYPCSHKVCFACVINIELCPYCRELIDCVD